jgi:hypothetical protein
MVLAISNGGELIRMQKLVRKTIDRWKILLAGFAADVRAIPGPARPRKDLVHFEASQTIELGDIKLPSCEHRQRPDIAGGNEDHNEIDAMRFDVLVGRLHKGVDNPASAKRRMDLEVPDIRDRLNDVVNEDALQGYRNGPDDGPVRDRHEDRTVTAEIQKAKEVWRPIDHQRDRTIHWRHTRERQKRFVVILRGSPNRNQSRELPLPVEVEDAEPSDQT